MNFTTENNEESKPFMAQFNNQNHLALKGRDIDKCKGKKTIIL